MRVHVLQHVPFEGLGSIAGWLAQRQAMPTVSRLYASTELPEPSAFDLLIVLGGPMSVNDEAVLPWLADEKRLVAECVRLGKPVLGICLGAQLIAAALGARVHPGAHQEIGWFAVEASPPTADTFRFPATLDAFHWHGETFDLPPGASHLARSAACAQQAFQLGARCIGLQFHLETTPDSVEALVAHGRHELVPAPFVQDEPTIRAAPATRYAAINALMGEVLDYLVR